MSPYFVPDPQMMKALTDAAKRGVEVVVVLPKSGDYRLVGWGGRWHYAQLLNAGIKLYENPRAMLHGKTLVIDGVWSTVGSANMDMWSFLMNDEVNLIIPGRDFAEIFFR
jgi:cardiolipin synthase